MTWDLGSYAMCYVLCAMRCAMLCYMAWVLMFSWCISVLNPSSFNQKKLWTWIGQWIFHVMALSPLSCFLFPDMAGYFRNSWKTGKKDISLVVCNSIYALIMVSTCLYQVSDKDSGHFIVFLLLVGRVYIFTWEMLKVALICGSGIRGDTIKSTKTPSLFVKIDRSVRLGGEETKDDSEKIPNKEESTQSQIKSKAVNANDIETNPGPPTANFEWLKNYIGWESDVHRTDSIIRDTNREIHNLYDDLKAKIIPVALYTLENLLILQKVQNIYLTHLKDKRDSVISDNISHLYNEWCIKVREQEQEKHATEAALSNAFIGGEVSATVSLSGPANLPENQQQDPQQADRSHGHSHLATNVILEHDHKQLLSGNQNQQSNKRSLDNLQGAASVPLPNLTPQLVEEGNDTTNQVLVSRPKKKAKRRTQLEMRECGIPCNFCPRYFVRKSTLAEHIKKTHPLIPVITAEEHQEKPPAGSGNALGPGQQGPGIEPTNCDWDTLQQVLINYWNLDGSGAQTEQQQAPGDRENGGESLSGH